MEIAPLLYTLLTDGEGRVRPVVRVAVTPVGRSTAAGPSHTGGIYPHRKDAGGGSILAVSFSVDTRIERR